MATGRVREVRFPTGSQTLYGSEVLVQVEQQSRQVADQLRPSGSLPVELVWTPVIASANAIRQVASPPRQTTGASA